MQNSSVGPLDRVGKLYSKPPVLSLQSYNPLKNKKPLPQERLEVSRQVKSVGQIANLPGAI
jgi:hypothetical protein